jgi:hypothetical protein
MCLSEWTFLNYTDRTSIASRQIGGFSKRPIAKYRAARIATPTVNTFVFYVRLESHMYTVESIMATLLCIKYSSATRVPRLATDTIGCSYEDQRSASATSFRWVDSSEIEGRPPSI